MLVRGKGDTYYTFIYCDAMLTQRDSVLEHTGLIQTLIKYNPYSDKHFIMQYMSKQTLHYRVLIKTLCTRNSQSLLKLNDTVLTQTVSA